MKLKNIQKSQNEALEIGNVPEAREISGVSETSKMYYLAKNVIHKITLRGKCNSPEKKNNKKSKKNKKKKKKKKNSGLL